MKNIVIVIICLLFCPFVFGQFECEVLNEDSVRKSGDIPEAVNFVPDVNTPVKYIRLNFHFMLREKYPSNQNSELAPRNAVNLNPSNFYSPGNFTPYSDGNGNVNYTGYDYAEELIRTANFRLRNNSQMTLPPVNSTPVLETKYQYVLNGVFFHYDNKYFYYGQYPNSLYRENYGESINVYLQTNKSAKHTIGGSANMGAPRYVYLRGHWLDYIINIDEQDYNRFWRAANCLNHEIGHNLSLSHTMRTPGGSPGNNVEDYCSDTPTREEMQALNEKDPLCGYSNDWYCSNNLMDYNGHMSLTPLQLGRVHWTMEKEMFTYKHCYFSSPLVTVTEFNNNKAYIGKKVIVPSENSVVVPKDNALFINSEEFVIEGEFEIKPEGRFVVNIVPSCN